MRDRDVLLVVGLVVLLAWGASVSEHPTLPDGNTIVSRTCTGGPTWRDDRVTALFQAGVTDLDTAHAIVALWGLESANGKAEWNYNLGNIIATPGPHLAYSLDSHDGNYWYRGYSSLEEAVSAWLGLLRSAHYAECWALLQTHPLSDAWVRCLGRKGYYTANADRYVAGWKARLAQLFPAENA